jgi:hypothetical protein
MILFICPTNVLEWPLTLAAIGSRSYCTVGMIVMTCCDAASLLREQTD